MIRLILLAVAVSTSIAGCAHLTGNGQSVYNFLLTFANGTSEWAASHSIDSASHTTTTEYRLVAPHDNMEIIYRETHFRGLFPISWETEIYNLEADSTPHTWQVSSLDIQYLKFFAQGRTLSANEAVRWLLEQNERAITVTANRTSLWRASNCQSEDCGPSDIEKQVTTETDTSTTWVNHGLRDFQTPDGQTIGVYLIEAGEFEYWYSKSNQLTIRVGRHPTNTKPIKWIKELRP